MERDEVVSRVNDAIDFSLEGRDVQLSEGARETIALMMVNIVEDPSELWGPAIENGIDPSQVQFDMMKGLPELLGVTIDEIVYRANQREMQSISSWEFLHIISGFLEKWCPFPKF